ncbi:hypothetical protein NCU16509 [Neurospora crassa OR74A]|uniref:Uncharacterized protein n=1 Tax=Neurospora crassa (strain ATCC 24698 / 74-OR23-1A / CBS 708.71 / DSM 1257 / FGSC 987) TaxID=367110 RepID=V5IN82_NEUCR|nr:hypothetical protein NCU16509 [Neurospora crassa OR74A]ESA43497.1 hypothetical protein NCU16509 [Neurospora crassa OR74A]|eukprot:XP_011393669.1 hypothetical protein NCU16509 [Neurospora crassa OR74A]
MRLLHHLGRTLHFPLQPPSQPQSSPVQSSPSFIPSPTPDLSSLVPSVRHSTHRRPPNPRTHPHQHHNHAINTRCAKKPRKPFPARPPGAQIRAWKTEYTMSICAKRCCVTRTCAGVCVETYKG